MWLVYYARSSSYAGFMLTIFRRHLSSCKRSSKGRKHHSCACPISVEGTLRGESIRKSVDLRKAEAASKLVREWEVNGLVAVATVKEATDMFVSDGESMKLTITSAIAEITLGLGLPQSEILGVECAQHAVLLQPASPDTRSLLMEPSPVALI